MHLVEAESKTKRMTYSSSNFRLDLVQMPFCPCVVATIANDRRNIEAITPNIFSGDLLELAIAVSFST